MVVTFLVVTHLKKNVTFVMLMFLWNVNHGSYFKLSLQVGNY
jgi:hypothetical protein